jgi:2-polyprenyl-6-methoxyphenol hydroxylase-like FAD-dependent oxidoreductase
VRVVVVGGGIAGCAAALALTEVGLEVVVLEARPADRPAEGAFLTVAGNGMHALRLLGVQDEVAAAGFPLDTLEVLDEDGARLGRMPLTPPPAGTLGHHHFLRADLHAALRTAVRRRGIALRSGIAAVDAEGGRVRLADGSTVAGELVVGADGVSSRMRTAVDPAAPAPEYAGQRVFWGCSPVPAPAGVPGTVHMVRGRRAQFGFLVGPDGRTWWFAREPGPELAEPDRRSPRWREHLADVFAADPTPAAGIVAATTEEIVADSIRHIPRLPRWSRPGLVLIGDAAHAASPAAGQGASMALEDAVALGECVRDQPDLAAALSAYEQRRRGPVEELVAASAAMTPSEMPDEAGREERNRRDRERYAKRAGAEGTDPA